jgi:hypothetical protein
MYDTIMRVLFVITWVSSLACLAFDQPMRSAAIGVIALCGDAIRKWDK